MKNYLILLFCCVVLGTEAQNWTWKHGIDTSKVPGTYGTMGVGAPANNPGGRHGCATWTDKAGNLWLFGGEGYSTNTTLCWLNDLWKYDKVNNQWTWIRGSNGPNSSGTYGTMGVSSPLNDPSAREFATAWTDTAGNFWMFGGDAYDLSTTSARQAGDLWKYNPTTNQWTWIKGFSTFDQYGVYNTKGSPNPSSLPGCRNGSSPWVDANNRFWLFGGRGWGASGSIGYLNDLWRYEPVTNEWTWINGSNAVLQPGAYGTMSVTSSSNQPGGRSFSGVWRVANGDAFIFGGVGHSSNTLQGYLGDLWKYEPSTNNWTWMSGFNVSNQNGNYGTMGQPSSAVKPGSRYSPASWVDGLGRLWLLGGLGYPGQGSVGNLNDLLRYDTGSGLWTLVKGDSLINRPGIHGTMGTASPVNKPGGRHYNTWWKGTGNALWLFGGFGIGKDSIKIDNMNDLWVFDVPCNPSSAFTTTALICSGSTATLSMLPPDNSPINWYPTPTSTTVLGTGSVYITPPLNTSSLTTMTFYASAATCSGSTKAPVTVTVSPLPQISFLNSPTLACLGQIVTLTVTGAQTYTWNTNSHNSSITLTATVPGYTAIVIGTNAEGCEDSGTHSFTSVPVPTVAAAVSSNTICNHGSVSFTAQGAQTYSWSSGQTTPAFTIASMPYGTFHYTVTGTDPNGCSSTATLSVLSSECVGITEYGSLTPITIYPNPATGYIIIDQVEKGELSYIIFDVSGKAVQHVSLNEGQSRIELTLPSGLYLIKSSQGARARFIVH